MDERKLEKLREVLVERLASGEEPADLRGQLMEALPADQADRLIADAGARVDAGRGDPAFARSLEEIRERRKAASGRRAPVPPGRPGFRATAGVFGALGAFAVLSAVTRGRPDISTFIAGLLFVIPAVALWRSNSRIAAGVLMGVCGVGFLVGAVFAVGAIADYGFMPFSIAAFWLILLLVAVRAFLGVYAARRGPDMSPVSEIFD